MGGGGMTSASVSPACYIADVTVGITDCEIRDAWRSRGIHRTWASREDDRELITHEIPILRLWPDHNILDAIAASSGPDDASEPSS
jgi:hypothetical protein